MENIFLYGTLLSFFQHPLNKKIQQEGVFLGKGFVRGKLFDLGSYPAAIPNKNSYVFGEVYKIPEVLFFDLDDYEDFNPHYIEQSLFKRKQTKVYLTNNIPSKNEIKEFLAKRNMFQSIVCWIYWYNKKINGHKEILSGNYLEYYLESFSNFNGSKKIY